VDLVESKEKEIRERIGKQPRVRQRVDLVGSKDRVNRERVGGKLRVFRFYRRLRKGARGSG